MRIAMPTTLVLASTLASSAIVSRRASVFVGCSTTLVSRSFNKSCSSAIPWKPKSASPAIGRSRICFSRNPIVRNLIGSAAKMGATVEDTTMDAVQRRLMFEDECILVDEEDHVIGHDSKYNYIIQAVRFAHEMQLKDMEARLAEAEARIKYSDPIEPELHIEQENEFHLEISEEPIYESLTGHEETKDFDLEKIEYPDTSNPHPPPEESISSEKIFDNCDDPEMISEADSLIVPVPVPISQTSDGLMTANGKLEDNFNFLTPDHYEQWLAFHHDSPMQSFIKNLQGLPDFKVWLNKEKYMFLGWYIPRKSSKLIKLGKGSSKSHPGQGLFRHLRSCFIHDMADSCSFYFSQSNSGKVKATSKQTIFKASSINVT